MGDLRSPLQCFEQLPTAAKSLRSLRTHICSRKGKTVQIISLRYSLCLKHNFHMLFIPKSAPSRLMPNEALPHTPTGLCPAPTSPLTPGPRLRFILFCLQNLFSCTKKLCIMQSFQSLFRCWFWFRFRCRCRRICHRVSHYWSFRFRRLCISRYLSRFRRLCQ